MMEYDIQFIGCRYNWFFDKVLLGAAIFFPNFHSHQSRKWNLNKKQKIAAYHQLIFVSNSVWLRF